MPDKRRHRGKHPDDDRLFAVSCQPTLRAAVEHLSWLLTRGYARPSALKLVGDRFSLTQRQRMAVRRSACSDSSLQRRRRTRCDLSHIAAKPLGIDGYNLLITVESALSGGLILVGRDGCYRDLASIHGTYRKVEETLPAVTLIADFVQSLNGSHIDWYLDRPVSNSGRLKVLMAETLQDRGRSTPSGQGPDWNLELVHSPDAVLADYRGVVASSDSVILDRCAAWTNLAAELITARIPEAWRVDLR
ncbi:MAG: DUF434 domain-containing protein [Phycisphaerae bacterium]